MSPIVQPELIISHLPLNLLSRKHLLGGVLGIKSHLGSKSDSQLCFLYISSEIIRLPEHFEFSAALVKTLFHFSFHCDFGIPPPPLAKNLGVPRKMYEKEKDIIPIKEKFRQKGIKTKNVMFFEIFC